MGDGLDRAGFLSALGATFVAQSSPSVAPAIRVATTPSDDMMSALYAWKTGLFEKAGADVRIDKMNDGGAVTAAVLSGKTYDVGKSSILGLLTAHERGIPLTLVAPAGIYTSKAPTGGFLVAKDSPPIRSGKDLENRTIAVATLKDIGQLAMQIWVEQHGGDPGTISFVELPMSAAATAVQQQRVFAAESAGPVLAGALAAGGVRFLPIYDAIAPRYLLTVWFTSKDYATQHPDALRTFARVCAASAAFTNSHHDVTAPMLAEFSGIPLPVLLHMARVEAGETLVPAQIQPVIDVAVKYHSLSRAFPAQELIDPAVSGLSLPAGR